MSYFTSENPLDCSDILFDGCDVFALVEDVVRSAQGLLEMSVSVSLFVG